MRKHEGNSLIKHSHFEDSPHVTFRDSTKLNMLSTSELPTGTSQVHITAHTTTGIVLACVPSVYVEGARTRTKSRL